MKRFSFLYFFSLHSFFFLFLCLALSNGSFQNPVRYLEKKFVKKPFAGCQVLSMTLLLFLTPIL